MNIVMIIPTGINCEIGGHAGDATPVARLLGSCVDKIILHPNVVNASDINEMPENALYVEGSILDRFLEGDIQLKEVYSNKILVVVNKPARIEIINAVNAARVTLGIDVKIVELDYKLRMVGEIYKNGKAGGVVGNWKQLVSQVENLEFDVLAIASEINVGEEVALHYFNNGGTNPWGGVEAIASKLIAEALNKPVAHAPILLENEINNLIWHELVCDPRMAAELISNCFLHCVLKGLHKAPRISNVGLSVKDIDYLITPMGCVGRPHQACMEASIPIIAVRENTTVLNDEMPSDWIYLDTYLEVAGFLQMKKVGITLESIRRPLKPTIVHDSR